jgi:hypothetical protein
LFPSSEFLLKISKNANLIHYKVNILSYEKNEKNVQLWDMHQSKNNHLSKVKKSNGIGYYPTLDYVMMGVATTQL